MSQETFEITIESDDSSDPDGLEEAGIQLGEELREIADVSISRVRAENAPPGTRSAGEWISAVIVVTALAGRVAAREHLGSALKDLLAEIQVVTQHWAQRNKGKKVKITLPDGTVVETTDVDGQVAHKIIKSLPPNARNSGE